jgi:hypothetical protein
MMANLGLALFDKPMMNARQVMIAEEAPKLNLVRCDIDWWNNLRYYLSVLENSGEFFMMNNYESLYNFFNIRYRRDLHEE